MWAGEGRERLMLESQADLAQVVDRVPVTFFFAPEKEAPGQTYAWELTTEAPATGLRLCAHDDGSAALGVHGADWQVVYVGEVAITERLAPLPRAYVVYAAETYASEEAALQRVLDGAFDIRNNAVIEVALDLPAQPPRPATRAAIVEYGSQRVVVQAVAEEAGLLLLGDQDYPGWQATVDGQRVPVMTANFVWRAVSLTPGEHQVVFELRPASVRYGLVLGLLALGVLLVLGIWEWRHWRSAGRRP